MGHLHPALKVPRVLQLKTLASYHRCTAILDPSTPRRPSALSFFHAVRCFPTISDFTLPPRWKKSSRNDSERGERYRGRQGCCVLPRIELIALVLIGNFEQWIVLEEYYCTLQDEKWRRRRTDLDFFFLSFSICYSSS